LGAQAQVELEISTSSERATLYKKAEELLMDEAGIAVRVAHIADFTKCSLPKVNRGSNYIPADLCETCTL